MSFPLKAEKVMKSWMSFPEIGLAQDRKNEISKTKWMSFPEIDLSHYLEN